MEYGEKKHYRFLIVFMLVLCLLSVFLSVLAVRRAESIQARQTYDEIYKIKKTFLRDTVRNVIKNIDDVRVTNAALAAEVRDRLAAELLRFRDDGPGTFAEKATELLKNGKYPGAVILRFEDATGRLLFASPDRGSAALPSSERTYRYFSYVLRSSLNEAWIDEMTKTSAAAMLHGLSYDNGGYVWVNEIRDWRGGDGYAVRRIHPNLKETEGILLSTETRDIAGNRPYLTELEGVRDRGEVFFTYFFKRPDGDRVAEKLTYATLYPRYQWIVAMGVYLEDVQTYIDAVAASSRALTARIVAYSVAAYFLLFLAALYFLSRIENRFITDASVVILKESNTDPLTGAFNRRMGDLYLANTFQKYLRGTEDSAILMFDIDDFKQVNDRYGHGVGDRVLQTIVESVARNMRVSDHLIRWGGEEFLVICYGIGVEEARLLAEKFRGIVAAADVPAEGTQDGNRSIRVTVSFGTAWFKAGDRVPEEVVARADEALYRAKAAGKNCVRTQDEA